MSCRELEIPGMEPGLNELPGNSLAVQWLGLYTLTVKGLGSIPGRGIKIPQAARRSQERKKESKISELPNLLIICYF